MKNREKKEFNKLYFKNDKDNIKKFYNSEGFLDVKIENYKYEIIDNNIYIYIKINEGFKTIINQIKIFGNEVVSDEEILKILNLKKNAPLSELYLSLKQLQIQNYYASKGYLYVNVNYELIDKENKYRKILYIYIEENKQVYIKDIILDSLPIYTQSVAKYVVNYKKGEIYTPQKIYSFQQKLYSTGLFTLVEFKALGINERKDSIIIVFKGRERKKHYFSGGLLYQFPDKGKLIGGFGNDNVFNNGEKLAFESSLIMNIETDSWFNANIIFSIPYLFNNLISYNFKSIVEREKNDFYSITSFSLTTGISKEIKKHVFSNNYKYKISVIDTNSDKSSIRFMNSTTNSSQLKIYYDSRNDPFYPVKGIFYSILFEYAGGILQGYNNFYKYMIEFAGYKTYMDRITNGMRIRTGFIIPFDLSRINDISIDEQFRLGGFSSVRGVPDDSLGPINLIGTHSGKMLVNINLESRLLLYNAFGISYFFDSGLLYGDVSTIDYTDFVVCGGIGFFVKTPVGPLRLDFARTLRGYKDNMEFYINIGNSF